MATKRAFNRRRHERFQLIPMYTSVTAQRTGRTDVATLSGHAYDISESGARIDFDETVAPGDHLDLRIDVPGDHFNFSAQASVVRCFDVTDDPGPRRVGVEFKHFESPEQRARLIQWLGNGHLQRAA